MTLNEPRDHPPEADNGISLPTDLSLWFDARTLTEWVQQELDKLAPKFQHSTDPAQPPCYDSQVMLSLLTLAHATGLFRSDQIVRACHFQLVLQGLCGGKPPFEGELIHFRRKHHRELEQILAGVFERAVRERNRPGSSPLPSGLREKLLSLAVARIQGARHSDDSI